MHRDNDEEHGHGPMKRFVSEEQLYEWYHNEQHLVEFFHELYDNEDYAQLLEFCQEPTRSVTNWRDTKSFEWRHSDIGQAFYRNVDDVQYRMLTSANQTRDPREKLILLVQEFLHFCDAQLEHLAERYAYELNKHFDGTSGLRAMLNRGRWNHTNGRRGDRLNFI